MSGSTPARVLKVVRRLARSKVVAAQVLLGLATLVLAVSFGWRGAIAGLILMNVITTFAALGLGSIGSFSDKESGSAKKQLAKLERRVERISERMASNNQVARLERRVDRLGARVVASSERTRVEVLDALAADRAGSPDRSS